ncbi:acireductone synthase [Sorangium sp. So ce131]|uniref:acireductone synthase n=1 Tax=Sorangium sp. So ce131 TaxID=3133282 RepID=UPI003F5DFEED
MAAPSARAVVVDVEGTTTDVRFVHDTLFPLARRELPAYVAAHPGSPEVEAARSAVARERGLGAEAVGQDELTAALLAWIDADRKETALKALQGKIWRSAYESGGLRSHVYPDVEPALRRWRDLGVTLAVFSSGSVEAQRLLFRHTTSGDLSGLFAAFFDTTTGPKREPAAYQRIAAALGLPPGDVLFLSDIVAELDAAAAAGMRTVQLLRPGTARDAEPRHAVAERFDEIALQALSDERRERPA